MHLVRGLKQSGCRSEGRTRLGARAYFAGVDSNSMMVETIAEIIVKSGYRRIDISCCKLVAYWKQNCFPCLAIHRPRAKGLRQQKWRLCEADAYASQSISAAGQRG